MKIKMKLFFAGALLLTLYACGTDDDPEEDNTEVTTEENTEETADSDAAENNNDDSTEGSTDDSESTEESDGSNDDNGSSDTTSSGEASGETDGSTESSIDGSSDTIALDAITTTPEDAISLAEENFDGELVELELDNDDNTWVYEVTMESDNEDYELQVTVEDLSVINESTEQDNNINIDAFSYGDAVPFDDAVQTAIDEVGGELEGFSLDMDNGILVYEIELNYTDNGDDMDVVVNAETGEVIEIDD